MLKVTSRKDRPGTLQIVGTIDLSDGTKIRIRQTADSPDRKIAEEQAATLHAKILRDSYHGKRPGSRSFAEAVASYLDAEKRSRDTIWTLRRIVTALGDVSLSSINQDTIVKLRPKLLRNPASDTAAIRGIITPIRAVMRYASLMDWCSVPRLKVPKQPKNRTNFLLPSDVRELTFSAAPHLKPLITFIVGTGARLSEALELEWGPASVDLVGARVTFWKTKTGEIRRADLPPIVVETLTDLAARCPTKVNGKPTGKVFRYHKAAGSHTLFEYKDRGRRGGGPVKTAWATAIKRSGIKPRSGTKSVTRHDLRHTWASWHYALHKDLLKLKRDGGWSTVALVERYAHLMPEGQEQAIRDFYGKAVAEKTA
jgi:integrase